MATVNGGRPVQAMDENHNNINVNCGSRVFGTCSTTDATPTEVVSLSGVQAGAYQYCVRVTGHNTSTAGEDVGYVLNGACSCAADGTMADVGTAVKDAFEHANSTGCDIAIDASADNKLAFKVTGEGTTNYTWSATLEIYGPVGS